jgi:hypothetical protein
MNHRADTSRANGARSQGPLSDSGKATSSLNAIKHGLTSNKLIVLQNENPNDYAQLAASFADTFQPVNFAEGALVQEMINAQWKRMRAEAIETALLDLALCALEPKLSSTFEGPVDHTVRIALAYRDNCENGGRALANIERQIVRLSRMFQKAHSKLKELQQDRKREEAEQRQQAEAERRQAAEAAAARAKQTAKPAARSGGPAIVEMPAKPAEKPIFPNEPGTSPGAAPGTPAQESKS